MTYFFNSIYKTKLAVAKQFSNIQIDRRDKNNNLLKTIKVEMIYQDKEKAYLELISNKTSQGINLPMISVYDKTMMYNLSRQQNNVESILQYQPENTDYIQAMRNPSPVTMQFDVVIATKYISDMHKILEIIVPMFQPTLYVNVNLVPEMNISYKMPIKLASIDQQNSYELSNEANSLRIVQTTLTLEVETFIFPPITDKAIAKNIELFTSLSKYTLINEYGVSDKESVPAHIETDWEESLLKTIDLQFTETKYNYVSIQDASSEITTYGDYLQVTDYNGNNYPFVFEYDNGELYGNDDMIPDSITASKTGNIFIKIAELQENTTLQLFLKSSHTKNYQFAYNVLKYYDDFSLRDYSRLIPIDKKEFDYVYVDDNVLKVKTTGTTISNTCRIYTKNSVRGAKTIVFGFSGYTFEASKMLCGVRADTNSVTYQIDGGGNYLTDIHGHLLVSDVTGDYIQIATSATTNVYNIIVDGAVVNTITKATCNTITFTYDGTTSWTVDIDGTSKTITTSDKIFPFICSNNTNILNVDYIKVY